MKALADYDLIIEIGPGETLKQLIHSRYPDKKVFVVNKPDDIAELKKIIADNAKDTQELDNGDA